jgi:hypothetical protein
VLRTHSTWSRQECGLWLCALGRLALPSFQTSGSSCCTPALSQRGSATLLIQFTKSMIFAIILLKSHIKPIMLRKRSVFETACVQTKEIRNSIFILSSLCFGNQALMHFLSAFAVQGNAWLKILLSEYKSYVFCDNNVMLYANAFHYLRPIEKFYILHYLVKFNLSFRTIRIWRSYASTI